MADSERDTVTGLQAIQGWAHEAGEKELFEQAGRDLDKAVTDDVAREIRAAEGAGETALQSIQASFNRNYTN